MANFNKGKLCERRVEEKKLLPLWLVCDEKKRNKSERPWLALFFLSFVYRKNPSKTFLENLGVMSHSEKTSMSLRLLQLDR